MIIEKVSKHSGRLDIFTHCFTRLSHGLLKYSGTLLIRLISKVPGLPDAPITVPGQEFQPAHLYYACGPRLNEHLQSLRNILDEYNAFAVGEMPLAKDKNQVLDAVRADRKELNITSQFDVLGLLKPPKSRN